MAAVVGLGITVGVMAAGDGQHGATLPNHMSTSDLGYQGMIGAIGSMDSDDMLKHMRDVLGEDGYQRMLAHLTDHRSGAPMTGSASVDQMMHTMMDGMIQSMPMGGGTVLPSGSDAHHGTPKPVSTTGT